VFFISTTSGLEGQKVAMSSESWQLATPRLISDSGLLAPVRRDQAHALRAQPRSHKLALENRAARRRTARPVRDPEEQGKATTKPRRQRNARREQDSRPTV
jgi:hypothetical protein